MRNTILRIIYAIGVFILTIVLLEIFISPEQEARTSDMEKASIPLLMIRSGDRYFNELHGFTEKRQEGKYRAVLTPLDEERQIIISTEDLDCGIREAEYEVRSLSGERLLMNGELSFAIRDNGHMEAEILLNDLVETGKEYTLVIALSTDSRKDLHYYTRIMVGDAELSREAIAFVQQFHNATFRKERREYLLTYLEPDRKAAQDDYSHVSINSTWDMVTFGDLQPTEVMKPVFSLREIQAGTIAVSGSFMVSCDHGETGRRLYLCEEYYRIRKGTERFHLLDYERSMTAVFDPEAKTVMGEDAADDRVYLGIAEPDQIEESENGEAVAFVNAGRLYGVSAKEDSIAYVYGFSEADSTDRKDNYDSFGIRILQVDEDCNIDFIVYGYMNRGSREGSMGVAEYYYDSEVHVVEERAFIPYYGSFELLKRQVENAAYLDEENRLYLILDDSLYQIDTRNYSYSILEENMFNTGSIVSGGGRFAAWRELENGSFTGRIILLDLEDLSHKTISADAGEEAVPVAFIGDDLIYGILNEQDRVVDAAGISYTPMRSIRIVNSELELLEDYTSSGYYISECEVNDNQIVLHRLRKVQEEGGAVTYVPAEDDQIMSASEEVAKEPLLQAAADEALLKVRSISVPGLDPVKLRYIRPRQLEDAGKREISVSVNQEEDAQRYYVYDLYGFYNYSYSASDAIDLAEKISGFALDGEGRYIWKRVAAERAEIGNIFMAETGAGEENGESTDLARCLDTILTFEGAPAAAGEKLAAGWDGVRILREGIPQADVMDLAGMDMDKILYYAYAGYPVIALTRGGQSAVVITGYGPENLAVLRPGSRERELIEREEARQLFMESGNRYIVYVKGE